MRVVLISMYTGSWLEFSVGIFLTVETLVMFFVTAMSNVLGVPPEKGKCW